MTMRWALAAVAMTVLVNHAAAGQAQNTASDPVTAALVAVDLRALPPFTGVAGAASARWDEFLRRCREAPSVALPAIANALLAPDDDVRRSAGLALNLLGRGNLADGGSVTRVSLLPILPKIAPALWSEHGDARATAATLLGMAGPHAAPYLTFLTRLLADEEEAPRLSAAAALGSIGPLAKDALPALQRLHKRSQGHPETQSIAQDAILEIGGLEYAVTSPPPGDILLLPRYEHVSGSGFDTLVGTIWRKGGPRISYDIGAMAGDRATAIAEGRQPFLWSKVQLIGGLSVRVTMQTKSRFVATFQESAANFEVTNIRGPEDLAEVLLILVTYIPPKY